VIATERRECARTGKWPEGYKGSVEERLDRMQDDLKQLSYAAMQNDDMQAARLCIAAHEAIYEAQRELDKWSYNEAEWSGIEKMQPKVNNDD